MKRRLKKSNEGYKWLYFFSEIVMNVPSGESVDGESVPQYVEAGIDVEGIFCEPKVNGGRNGKTRGKLPVLVLFNALNWVRGFPNVPTHSWTSC